MKKLLFILIVLSIFSSVNAQDYDLIVTTEGDSIACFIDSISEAKIYFKMKSRDRWIKTNLTTNQVVRHEFNVINKSGVIFREGTSIIIEIEEENPTTKTIRKNSVFLGIAFVAYTVNYERVFPITNKIGISLRLGLGYDFYNKNPLVLEEVNLLVGGHKSFFELGLGHQFPGKIPGLLILRPGYRYQSFNGFLLKLYPLFLFNLDNTDDWKYWGFFGVSIGQTF